MDAQVQKNTCPVSKAETVHFRMTVFYRTSAAGDYAPLNIAPQPECAILYADGVRREVCGLRAGQVGMPFHNQEPTPVSSEAITCGEPLPSDGLGDFFSATVHGMAGSFVVRLVSPDLARHGQLQADVEHAAGVRHPRLARVLGIGTCRGQTAVVMERLQGESLESRLQRLHRLSERDALEIVLTAAEALAALHEAGLCHGSVFPANLVETADAGLRLAAPGLLGALRRDVRGKIHGLPPYIAPELAARGSDTPQSDIFSLGVTLYRLLTGHLPFGGRTPDEVARAQQFAVVMPVGVHDRSLSAPTRELVARMMKRDPNERPRDCQAVASEVRAALASLSAAAPWVDEAPPVAPPPPTPPPPRNPRLHALLLALCGAMGVGLFSLVWWFGPLGDGHVPPVRRPPRPLVHRATADAAIAGPDFDTAAVAAAAACTRRVRPTWQYGTIGEQSLHGLSYWRGEDLTLIGDGLGLADTADSCRYLHTAATPPFVLSAHLLRLATVHARASAGILVRDGIAPSAPCVFLGCLGSGNVVLQCRRRAGGPLETIRTQAASAGWQPRHLRIECGGSGFRAAISDDGVTWQIFGTCRVEMGQHRQVGLALSEGAAATMATAEMTSVCLSQPPPRITLEARPGKP
jgi:hypothetical protein